MLLNLHSVITTRCMQYLFVCFLFRNQLICIHLTVDKLIHYQHQRITSTDNQRKTIQFSGIPTISGLHQLRRSVATDQLRPSQYKQFPPRTTTSLNLRHPIQSTICRLHRVRVPRTRKISPLQVPHRPRQEKAEEGRICLRRQRRTTTN